MRIPILTNWLLRRRLRRAARAAQVEYLRLAANNLRREMKAMNSVDLLRCLRGGGKRP